MSNADRLRAAADKLEHLAARGIDPSVLRASADKLEHLAAAGVDPSVFARQDRATIVLLRTVWRLHGGEHVCPDYASSQPMVFGGDDLDPCPVMVAAVAVADTILGVKR